MKNRRRARGTVGRRKGREGWWIRWRWTDNGGKARSLMRRCKTKAAGSALLTLVDAEIVKGASLPNAVAIVCDDVKPATLAAAKTGDTWASLWPEYKADTGAGKKESTSKANGYRANSILRAGWTALPIVAVTRAHLRDWCRAREKAGRAAQTIRNDLSLASDVFDWAQCEERIGDDAQNPFITTRKWFARRAKAGMERTAFTQAEVKAFLADARAHESPAFVLTLLGAVTTGWRRDELRSATWANLHDAKTGAPYIEPLTSHAEKTGKKTKRAYLVPEIAEALREARRKDVVSMYLFPGPRGGRWANRRLCSTLQRVLARCAKAETVAVHKVVGDEVAKLKRADWHSLRHTARSILRDLGFDDHSIGAQLGQDAASTAATYTTVRPKRLIEHAEKMSAALSA